MITTKILKSAKNTCYMPVKEKSIFNFFDKLYKQYIWELDSKH